MYVNERFTDGPVIGHPFPLFFQQHLWGFLSRLNTMITLTNYTFSRHRFVNNYGMDCFSFCECRYLTIAFCRKFCIGPMRSLVVSFRGNGIFN